MNLSIFGILFVTIIILLLFATLWLTLRYARRRATFAPLTEQRLRLPGHKLRIDRNRLREAIDDVFYLLIVALSAGLFSIVFKAPALAIVVTIAFTCAVSIWAMLRLKKLMSESRDLLLGLECEEYVGQELNLLMRHGAYVFHDVPCDNGNIDHVVIGHGQALAVETKGRRKPRKGDSGRSREYEVSLQGDTLIFPSLNKNSSQEQYKDTKSVKQVKANADILAKSIKKHCGIDFEVIPVIAIPGWKINYPPYQRGNVLLVSPKRDSALKKWLGRDINEHQTQAVADYIDSIVRSVDQKSEITDPDASDHFDFWFNRKSKEKKLD